MIKDYLMWVTRQEGTMSMRRPTRAPGLLVCVSSHFSTEEDITVMLHLLLHVFKRTDQSCNNSVYFVKIDIDYSAPV